MAQVEQEQYEEMKEIVRMNLCAECGGELTIRTNPGLGTLEVGCPRRRDHHGYVEKETWTQRYRRGQGAPLVIKDRIEKKMLPGGYEVGTALALIKTRFPRADLDDPSAALFLMDCIRLDLDPLLGEIIPVTFKNKDRKVVQPVLTEDGWLSLAARACPDRWAGPPVTEPVTDKEFKKELCDDEDAWVWKASGRTKDGAESVAYGWLKRKEWEKAKAANTPAGDLPGNQARVRSIKRWVRETFPEARKKMMELTSEWLARGREKGIDEVQRVIEAEYHIVTNGESSNASEPAAFTRNGQPNWARFWGHQKEKGLDEEKVHAMLGVSSLKVDWVGKGRTLEEADAAIDRALEVEKDGELALELKKLEEKKKPMGKAEKAEELKKKAEEAKEDLYGKPAPPQKPPQGQPEPAKPAPKPVRDPKTIRTINDLCRACFEDWGLQPKDLSRELGLGSLTDLAVPPSEAYLAIKAIKSPTEVST